MQLPQLDFNYYPSQLFWLIICYSLLYIILKFCILPKFSKLYKNREEFLNSRLLTAKENIINAMQLLEISKNQLLEAKNNAAKRIAKANIEAEAAFNQRKIIIDQKYTLILKEANIELEKFQNSLKENASNEIAKSSSLILEKIFDIVIPSAEILNKIKDNKNDY